MTLLCGNPKPTEKQCSPCTESPEIQWLRPDSGLLCFPFILSCEENNRGHGIQKEILGMGFMQQCNLERQLALNSDNQHVYSIAYLLVTGLNVEAREPSLFIDSTL